ncbi:E3 UFM1-protein ligase 1 homolog [Dendronephthya gigantea]|uniref:E3 UFM1-protein ligase 1 homolog n=1 Tax=Dendronephthya gigantea TaxID=151771 RepID=UPI00106DBA98|nr:E3 UFM1-protein ligase 1 homolog [Dendronephthya gigantea]
MSDWEEVKRLAADFQRAQLSSTSHKLSERNCVELIQKLINLGLIEVIYTTDGREYLTPAELEKEIREELFVEGGRINLVDLQQVINVDLSHIENKVAELIKTDRSLVLVQGELIEKQHLDHIAEEINEKLQESGLVSIGELAKTFGFTTDFMLETIEDRLGSIIHGKLDRLERGVLFTDAFIARHTSRIRGVLSAITRPTSLSSLIIQYDFQEKLFNTVINDLIKQGRLSGTIQGRQDKANFIPDIYSKTQNDWVDAFYQQNGYLEYDNLSRLGITDVQGYLKRRFKTKSNVYLKTCCAGPLVVGNLEAAVDEALSSGTWLDVMTVLPSPFLPDDAAQLLEKCLNSSGRTSAHVFCGSIVASETFIEQCVKPFEKIMQEKAEKDAVTSPALLADLSKKDLHDLDVKSSKQDKKEERRAKASIGGGSKGGGGRGAREVKTKKKDKSKLKAEKQTEEEETKPSNQELQFMTQEEIGTVLTEHLNETPEELVDELSEYLHRPLMRKYQEVARTVFLTSGDQKRKLHVELQDKVTGLYTNIRLFQKGVEKLPDDVQPMISRHLLKTLCTDMANLAINCLAADQMMAVSDPSTLTNETRLKIISKLPEKNRNVLGKLTSSLNGKDLEEFLTQFDVVSGPGYCEILVKKLDKKRERSLLAEHRQNLMEQLRQETEPAMGLHLAAVILFQQHTGCMIHIPGKCVPHIITYLAEHMSPDDHVKLTQYQGLVVKHLTKGGEVVEKGVENGEKSVEVLLEEGLNEVKSIALRNKKPDNALSGERTSNGKSS